jgi:zinc/manganese transport system substrate-binding protein
MQETTNTSTRVRSLALVLALTGAMVLTACTTAPPSAQSGNSSVKSQGTVIQVAAAENFWGSIASQIGGEHAHVVSIITNPDTDPHSYEPTSNDAKLIAGAQMVIENGIGYDPWVPQLLSADQTHPTVLDVGTLVGVADGGNPHRWYNPQNTQQVERTIVSDYQALDPADAAYFARQASIFTTVSLKPYSSAIEAIKAKYSGTPVGASESIFAMLAPALGLNLITPPTFLRATSEGTEVTTGDKETIDNQIKSHLIKIYVYNSQNVTPDVQAQLAEVKAEHIPYSTITETLAPASSTYEAWQTRQLLEIQAALAKANQSK